MDVRVINQFQLTHISALNRMGIYEEKGDLTASPSGEDANHARSLMRGGARVECVEPAIL